ncbi:MAG: FAD-dependent oxidoreductase, partial [Actinobacteria bacterium]|nr:FAD-dependent oxidoreductase [Actinomycetota bacterium]
MRLAATGSEGADGTHPTTCVRRLHRQNRCSLFGRRRRVGALARMKAEVAIVGAGYVGVPLAQVFADAGRSVVLVDVQA